MYGTATSALIRVLIVVEGAACAASGMMALQGCDADTNEFDELESVSEAATAADEYNKDGVSHNEQDIPLNKSAAEIRDYEFRPIGALAQNTPVEGHCTDARPCVRMQGLEAIETPSGTTYYMWGTGGNRSGHIHVADLEERPKIDEGKRAGNGKPCKILKRTDGRAKSYKVKPHPIEETLRYLGPSTGEVYSFQWYGTPGAGEGLPDYTYLTWSWINKEGGGITRALVPQDDVFYPCDVEHIRSHSLSQSRCDSCDEGWVEAMYGMVQQGGHRYYGWIVYSHQFRRDPIVHHVAKNDD